MTPFPTSLPEDAVTSLITNFKNGTLTTNVPEISEAAWNLVGYGLHLGVGSPAKLEPQKIEPTDNPFVGKCEAFTDEKAIACLEQLKGCDSTSIKALPIPWATLIQWAANLLITLLNNRAAV